MCFCNKKEKKKTWAKIKLAELKRRNTNACLNGAHKNQIGDLKTMSCSVVCFKLDILLRDSQAGWCFKHKLKVPLWSNSRYPVFYIFVHNRSFLVILRNFTLLRTLQREFFWTFFSENLAPPLIFLVPILGWKLEKMTSFSQKYRTELNYNKNKCGKLHDYRGQSFCSSSCELPY